MKLSSSVRASLVALLSVLSLSTALAEDMTSLAPASLEYLRNLVPAERGQSSAELLRWYELMQMRSERERAIGALPLAPTSSEDTLRMDAYVRGEMAAHDPEMQRLTGEIRTLQARIQNEILRDELMMWYAPQAYLRSIRSERHKRYLTAFGWSPATTVAQLVGRPDYVKSLQQMHDGVRVGGLASPAVGGTGLRSARLREEGWSETFWPDVAGSLAAPYPLTELSLDDPERISLNFINFLSYGSNRPILEARHAVHQRIAQGGFRREDGERLSPAEKYDLLVGDTEFTFTNRVLDMVKQIDDDRMMAAWSGVCDGWSSAALNYNRPERAVEVTGARGHRLKFYPADIKGLASFLWAKSFDRSGLNYTFGGGYQCRDASAKDGRGRLLDPRCNDMNPGFFHTAAVNLIGVDNHGFVFDRSHGTNVMNQPAFAYEYKYFRPDNGFAETTNLERAKKRIGQFNDPFRDYRSPLATHVVGVKMKVWYKKEHPQPRGRDYDFSPTDPNRERFPSRTEDRNLAVDLRYDLELDASGNIVGGEWWFYEDIFHPNMMSGLDDSHPDTIWLVVPGISMFSTVNEGNVPAWNPASNQFPSGVLPYARAAANTMKPPFGPNDVIQHDVYRPQPLSSIVFDLVTRARPGRERTSIARIPGRYRNTFVNDPANGGTGWMTEADWLRPDSN